MALDEKTVLCYTITVNLSFELCKEREVFAVKMPYEKPYSWLLQFRPYDVITASEPVPDDDGTNDDYEDDIF